MNEIKVSKGALRREIRSRLASMPESHRITRSAQACELLRSQHIWHEARSLLLFAPLAEELDVWPLLADALHAGKTLALPSFSTTSAQYGACQITDLAIDLKTGKFDIREPADHCQNLPLNRLDLILVPGIAFDLVGRRLGRGKGYYDRLLAAVSGTRCGVAFDEQIVGELPVAPHDACVNCILTPTRWIRL